MARIYLALKYPKIATRYTIISGITISVPKFINGSLENTVKKITIKIVVPIIYASNIFFAVSKLSFLHIKMLGQLLKLQEIIHSA